MSFATGPRGWAALVAAIVAISTAAPLVRWAQPAPALAVATLRVTLVALLLWIVGGNVVAELRKLTHRQLAWVIAAGVLLGVHFAVWISSLYFTSTAASVALVATNPVFAALFGQILGDKVRGREWAGIAVAGCGCAILAGGDWSSGGDAIIGDLLAVLGAATSAACFVVGRGLRDAMPLGSYLAALNTVAAIGLVGFALTLDTPLLSLPGHSYAAIAGAALIASLVGHTLLTWAVRHTPAHLVTLSILGEPVGASLLAWGFFSERPPAHAAIGGVIILVGISLGFAGRRD